MNSPKVPQAVPMEKESPAATRKTMVEQQFHGQVAGLYQHADVVTGAQVLLAQGADGPGQGQDDVGTAPWC